MSPDRASQAGSLLLELMLVTAVTLALAVWGVQEWAQRSRDLQAHSLATWMLAARDALSAYLERYGAQLAGLPADDALSGQGFATWSSPQWSELQAAGLLPAAWQAIGPMGRRLAVHVVPASGCVQVPCLLQGLVHVQSPLLTRTGEVDQAFVAEWLVAAQGYGLVAWPAQPAVLAGPGVRWPVPAAWAGSVPAGTVALLVTRAGAGPPGDGPPDLPPPDPEPADSGPSVPGGDEADFLRVGDARDPDFQGPASVQGTIRSGSQLVAADGLLLENLWSDGQACAAEGAVGRARAGPGLMECRGGLWRTLLRPAGGGYLANSRRGCADAAGMSTANPVTGSCSCPASYLMVRVSESGAAMSSEGLTVGYICVPR